MALHKGRVEQVLRVHLFIDQALRLIPLDLVGDVAQQQAAIEIDEGQSVPQLRGGLPRVFGENGEQLGRVGVFLVRAFGPNSARANASRVPRR